jgi:light-regulated signal transduction histidine kinase (bacteriophytochrome)
VLKRQAALLVLIVVLTGFGKGAAVLLAQSGNPQPVEKSASPGTQRGADIVFQVFGRTLRLRLSIGVLGVLIILSLAILLAIAFVLAVIARRRLREAQAANRRLEGEIRERKRAEEEVQQLNASLESRVAERTQEVQEANQQLAAINTELEAFAYSVSHDLRTPLRGIDGWSLALLEDYGEKLDERAREYLDRVRSETQRMGRLIDDLLQLSKVTRAEMQRNPVDLTTVASGIAAQLQEAHRGRRISFAIAPGLTTRGDAGLLQIVLTNLLSNAVKFTGTREEARIQFGRNEQNDESPFFVRDNGVGFDMAFAGTLFGAFQRLHKDTEFPGTGIGLATVQRVVHRHGGRVWAEAEAGKGATFYFTMGPAK